MASLTGLELEVDWQRATGVTSTELAATWCSLEVKIAGRPVTLVEDVRGGGLRRAVHTSAYPLAEWIATHWFSLHDHMRPSATSPGGWVWHRVTRAPWLRNHNVRAAGDGMAWPDLTLVPEGAMTRLVWAAGPGVAGQPVSFLTSGDVYLSTDAVRAGLAQFVNKVLDRLSEEEINGTLLQHEWAAIADLPPEERDFAAAAARLGMDPFDVSDAVAAQIASLSRDLDPALFEEFLNSANADGLATAAGWLETARASITPGRVQAGLRFDPASDGGVQPWLRGYTAAQAYRGQLGLKPTERIDLKSVVGLSRVAGDPAGLNGVVEVFPEGPGLALPVGVRSGTATRFAQARALGLSLLTTRTTALLDPTHTDLSQQTRAFAAEVLAPAEGIADFLSAFPTVTDRAVDAVADRYGASPLLVQHQYDNQLS